MKVLKTTVTITFAVFFSFACGGNTPVATDKVAGNTNKPTAATPAPSSTAAVKDETAMAANLYTVHCMTCHKDSGKGGPVTVDGKKLDPDDLTAEKFKKMSEEKLIGYVRDGIVDEGMPSFKEKLTDEEMVAVIKHVRTLQSK